MKLLFKSISSSSNAVRFESDFITENNMIIFNDLSLNNTKICIEKNDDSSIIFKRIGDVEMILPMYLKKESKAYYNNKQGLEFEFKVKTISLMIENDMIFIEYETNIMDFKENHKIFIYINN